jgi:hypothetical protein
MPASDPKQTSRFGACIDPASLPCHGRAILKRSDYVDGDKQPNVVSLVLKSRSQQVEK